MRFGAMSKRIIGILLVLCLLTPSVFAAWDGYPVALTEEESVYEDGRIVIFDGNDAGKIHALGLVPKTISGCSGAYAAGWLTTTTKKSLNLTDLPVSDWTETPILHIRMYSEKTSGAGIEVVVQTELPANSESSMSYARSKMRIDWSGWKEFTYDIDNMDYTDNSPDMTKVTNLLFSAGGWSNIPSDKTKIYIDSIWLTPRSEDDGTSETFVDDYTTEEMETAKSLLAESDAAAAYIYSDKLYRKDSRQVLDESNPEVTPIKVGDTILAPLAFFEAAAGVQVSSAENIAVLTKGDVSITAMAGAKGYSLNCQSREFSTEVRQENGTFLIPAVEALEALGISARQFWDDRMVIAAPQEALQKINAAPGVMYAIAYLVFGEYDPSDVTAEDFKEAKDRFRFILCGDEENNDITDPDIASKIKSINNSGAGYQKSMNRGEDIPVLWGTTAVSTTAQMATQANSILAMAKAWGTYGCELYHDASLLADIKYALEWFYENLYGYHEINGNGWRSVFSYNWHNWYYGVPYALIRTLLIIEDQVTKEEIKKYTSCYEYILGIMMTAIRSETAQPRMMNLTLYALLIEDTEKLKAAETDYNLLMGILDSNVFNGMRMDGSYFAHDMVYTMQYGAAWMERNPIIAYGLTGTALEFHSPRHYNMIEIAKTTFGTVMYNGQGMTMLNGRYWGNSEMGQAVIALSSMLTLVGVYGEEEDRQLKQLIKRNLQSEEMQNRIKSKMELFQFKAYKEIMEDESIPFQDDYTVAHSFYTGDKAVQQRNNYAFALSMSSSRGPAYESINGCNLRGWYSGDGMLYLYTDKDSSAFDTNNFVGIDSVVYGLPGTTEDVQERQAISVNGSSAWRNPKDFVGAIDFQGEYLVGAMDFEAFHNDVDGGALDYGGSGSYGGAQALHDNDLVAKKSWFMFDDEAVCLGTGITSSMGYDVNTYIENRRLLENDDAGLYSTDYDPNDPNIPVAYPVKSVSATKDDGNVPSNVIDSDLTTRWSAEGTGGCDLVLELEEEVEVGYIGIAIYNGNNGIAIFDLEVSSDGENWTQVWSGKSDGTTANMQAYDIGQGVRAKYVKLVGHGRETSQWNSFTEIRVYEPKETGVMPVEFSGDVDSNKVLGIDDVWVNGELMEKTDWRQTYKGKKLKWFAIEGVGGYYFPQGGTITVEKQKQTASNETQKGMVKAYFEHGESPKNSDYAYVIVPYAEKEEMEAYAAKPHVSILSNTEALQAVKEKNLNMKGMVFYRAGMCEEITVDTPCIAAVQEKDGAYAITVSEPTLKQQQVTVTINKKLALQSCDSEIQANVSENKTVLTIDFSEAYGKPVDAAFTVR